MDLAVYSCESSLVELRCLVDSAIREGSLTQSKTVRHVFCLLRHSRGRKPFRTGLIFRKWNWNPADKTSPSGARSYKPSVAFTFFGEPPKRARSYKNVTAASVLESDWVLDLARLWASLRGRTRPWGRTR